MGHSDISKYFASMTCVAKDQSGMFWILFAVESVISNAGLFPISEHHASVLLGNKWVLEP